MAQFPSSIISFPTHVNGQIIDANDVNSPDNEITALENKVGVDGSGVATSLDYIAKNASSNGGGHVQTANTGGTGFTSYSKGDLIVGQSSSVLGRQSAGTDGYALTYDSTKTNGLSSAAILTAPTIQNQNFTYAQGSVISASVYAAQITPIPSALSQGQAFSIKWPTTNTGSILALSISSLIAARIKNQDGTNPVPGAIQSSMISTVQFDAVSSVFQLQKDYVPAYPNDNTKFLRGDFTWAAASPTGFIAVVTKDISDASTTQTITHGLGRIPKLVWVYTTCIPTGFNRAVISDGGYDGTNNKCVIIYNNGTTADTVTNSATNSIYIRDNNNNGQSGVITVDATNITITWTKQTGGGGTTGTATLSVKSF